LEIENWEEGGDQPGRPLTFAIAISEEKGDMKKRSLRGGERKPRREGHAIKILTVGITSKDPG